MTFHPLRGRCPHRWRHPLRPSRYGHWQGGSRAMYHSNLVKFTPRDPRGSGSHAPKNQRCVWVLGTSLIWLRPLYLLQLICATLIHTVFWFFWCGGSTCLDLNPPPVWKVVPRKTTKNRSGGLRFDIFGGSRYINAARHEFFGCFFVVWELAIRTDLMFFSISSF